MNWEEVAELERAFKADELEEAWKAAPKPGKWYRAAHNDSTRHAGIAGRIVKVISVNVSLAPYPTYQVLTEGVVEDRNGARYYAPTRSMKTLHEIPRPSQSLWRRIVTSWRWA